MDEPMDESRQQTVTKPEQRTVPGPAQATADRPERRTVRKPELLAPAGDIESFRAALMAGADAIYLGMGSLNARRNAANFTTESLAQACRMAHLAGRKIYLTANTLVLDDEFTDALDLIATAWSCGIDAVIVQDLGLLDTVISAFPQIPVHVSTQMNIMNEAAIRLLQERGVSRVTLAREASLPEITLLTALGVECEVFAHGALCICYSGQCLMSSLIGRRSANRGLCAQPCRLAWELIDGQGRPVDSTYGAIGEHLLSPKDLCTISLLPQLIDAGVASLKIEGRMKSPEYVATITATYRAALDRAYRDRDDYRVDPHETDMLEEAFSRGFSTAYLTGERGNEMMGYQRPNNRGVFIGRVTGIADGLVAISADKPIESGDTLEFWTSRGRHDQTLSDILVDDEPVDGVEAGTTFHIRVDAPVSPGDRVFRVRSASLSRSAEALYSQTTGVVTPIAVDVAARLGEPLSITVTDGLGRSGAAQGRPCEAARTKALTCEDIEAHVGRMGGTPYEVSSWNIALDENVGMGFSALHNLRRQALESYEASVLSGYASRDKPEVPRNLIRMTSNRVGETRTDISPEMAVLTGDERMAQISREAGAIVYAPAGRLADWKDAEDAIALMPTVVHDSLVPDLVDLARRCPRVVADSLEAVALLSGGGIDMEAGPHMNLLNQRSIACAGELGCDRVWLSPELSIAQIRDLAAVSEVPLSLTVFGRQELMVTEHCELMAMGPCDRRCSACARRRSDHALRDRKGYVFPIRTDVYGHGHIYNSVELDVTPSIPELRRCGVRRFIIDATLLDEERLRVVLSRVAGVIAMRPDDGSVPFTRLENTTTGHLFRGVL